MKLNRLIDTPEIISLLDEVLSNNQNSRPFIQYLEKVNDVTGFIFNLIFNKFKCLLLRRENGKDVVVTSNYLESLLSENDLYQLESLVIFEILMKRWKQQFPIYFEKNEKGEFESIYVDSKGFDMITSDWDSFSIHKKVLMINRLEYLNDRSLYNLVYKKAKDEKD